MYIRGLPRGGGIMLLIGHFWDRLCLDSTWDENVAVGSDEFLVTLNLKLTAGIASGILILLFALFLWGTVLKKIPEWKMYQRKWQTMLQIMQESLWFPCWNNKKGKINRCHLYYFCHNSFLLFWLLLVLSERMVTSFQDLVTRWDLSPDICNTGAAL